MAKAWSPTDVKKIASYPITADGTYDVSRAYSVTAGGARVTKIAVKLSGSNTTGTFNINLKSGMSAAGPFVEYGNLDTIANADGWHFFDYISTTELLADVAVVELDAAGGAQFTVDEVKIFQET